MKLFLASHATDPATLQQIKAFIGGNWKNKTIAFIPTARNAKERGSWKSSDSYHTLLKLGAEIKVIELENYYKKNLHKEFKDVDIIWFAGGQTAYLLYWIRKVGLDTYLPELLSKSILYVGSSAGSMICSKTQYASEFYIGEPEPGAALVPGLGYVDFEIYPHYSEELKSELERLWKKGKLYLLKDGEAILKEDGKITVLGEERIISN